MRHGRSRFRRSLVIAAGAGVLVVSGSATAVAGPARGASVPPSPGRPTSAVLHSADLTAAALAPGCYGQTDQPHPSGHVPGNVNVEARTVCPGLTDYVSTSLYRDRWYGQQHLADGSNTRFGRADTSAAWRCAGTGTYTYRAYSYHEASDGSYAYTGNSRRFTC